MRKIKIFNDPVYGFLRISNPVVFQIIEHPYFQRLRRIKQLGLSDLVYPGAHHSRFHHSLGAVHLMEEAIDNLKIKGIEISEKEADAAIYAILLHDIGHGPYSHALEKSFLPHINHEEISLAYMHFFNNELNGALKLAIEIFKGNYHRKFFRQLVSGQIDVDRLDYLRRDSFYTGVSEGIIGSDRIIKMMNVVDDVLVVDEKGIYSIEKFLLARNLMYWQVYLHKTVIGAEVLLSRIIQRAKKLRLEGNLEVKSAVLDFFLSQQIVKEDLYKNPEILRFFSQLDDSDVLFCIKDWMNSKDQVLAQLCTMLIDRKLFKILLQSKPFESSFGIELQQQLSSLKGFSSSEAEAFIIQGSVGNTTYQEEKEKIKIYMKNGEVIDFSEASQQYDLNVLTKEVQKYYICFPKKLSR